MTKITINGLEYTISTKPGAGGFIARAKRKGYTATAQGYSSAVAIERLVAHIERNPAAY